MQAIIETLRKNGLRVSEQEPLSRHTSFRIGGPVRAMVLPDGEEQLIRAVGLLGEAGISPLLIGNGSNLLAADGAIDRIAVKTHDGVARMERLEGGKLYASAGALLSRAATFARDQGLSGMEFAHGIPGTLGGAVFMNAGAYGGEMTHIVTQVDYLDHTGTRQRLTAPDLGFSYRHSRFSDTKELILGATLTLTSGDSAEIGDRLRELAEKRKNSQPLEFPSGGSTFKRPKAGYAAAMIDEAGLKGYTIGGAQVSEKHAGFVINRGDASFDDVRRLMAHIQETVFARIGVMLEPEVEVIV